MGQTASIVPTRGPPGWCRYNKVAAIRNIGGDEVIGAVMAAQGGGKNAVGHPHTRQRQLAGVAQNIPNLLQVSAVEDGHTGEIGKRGIDKVEITAQMKGFLAFFVGNTWIFRCIFGPALTLFSFPPAPGRGTG